MRLRPLTEAECYARCYGGVRTEQVSVLRPVQPDSDTEHRVAVLVREPADETDPRSEAA